MLSRVWPRSLRGRLTLVFVALAGATVALAAVGIYRQVELAMWSHIDSALGEEADLLATVPRDERDLGQLVEVMAAERDLGPRKFVAVLDGDGRVTGVMRRGEWVR